MIEICKALWPSAATSTSFFSTTLVAYFSAGQSKTCAQQLRWPEQHEKVPCSPVCWSIGVSDRSEGLFVHMHTSPGE